MKKVLGDAKSVSQLLWSNEHSVDYCQRENNWDARQMANLIADLTTKFLESYEPGQVRTIVQQHSATFQDR